MASSSKDWIQTISTLFSDKYFTLIPSQRCYSWKQKHVEDYWNDILSIAKARKETPHNNINYFMGYVVLLHNKGAEKTTSSYKQITGYSITDGQQRLTTTVIFVASLLREFRKLEEPEIIADLTSTFIAVRYK